MLACSTKTYVLAARIAIQFCPLPLTVSEACGISFTFDLEFILNCTEWESDAPGVIIFVHAIYMELCRHKHCFCLIGHWCMAMFNFSCIHI